MHSPGLTGRLGRELLRQAVLISIAVAVSMFVAGLMIEDVLIEQALEGEADYYWQRVDSGQDSLPDTQNLTAYREGHGNGVPPEMERLKAGMHRQESPRESVVFVSERNGERLYLLFEAEQVDKLVLIFGTIPLALALIVIYVSTWLAYRVSRRAVSPVVSLAQAVRRLDPESPNPKMLNASQISAADDDVRVLSGALEDLVVRIGEFTERERHFTRDASHELRTPLTVIKMALDRLDRDPDLSEETRKNLERIRNSAEDMESLTQAFLLLARELEQGLAREWIDVNRVVETELERAQLVTSGTAACRVEKRNELWVFAPEKILESVIGNLLRNAVAYTDQGEVRVIIENDKLVIDDTGPGMSDEEVGTLFKPFTRGQRRRGGFGVGLTIVKRLTRRFEWPLSVESEPGRGTRVEIHFPEARQRRETRPQN
ncbi:MAG: HAMP domain-containing sensor histidine kinase [Lysobacterales bacterium]|jgi:signal transduction histidine kinase